MKSAIERESAALLPVYPQLPIVPVSAEGCELETADGRRILDLYGGHAVAALGYGHPVLTDAICRQARELIFQSNAVALDVRATATERLLSVAPAHLTRAFFVTSGAEANENALRLACSLTGRRKVLALTHGFHGRTAAAAAVTYGSSDSWYGFPETPFDVDFIPRDDAAAAQALIDDSVAAVIFEPVQGIAGAYALADEFVQTLREATSAVGAMLIADEVQCGMGRTGAFFAVTDCAVEPDMLTNAKALGGGLPCAVLLTTEAVASRVRLGQLGSTFGGGPVAAAAVCAVIDTIEKEALLDNARRREQQVRDTCVRGPVEGVQGRGLLLGLKLSGSAAKLQALLLEKGLLTGTSSDKQVLRLLPPLNVSAEHIDRLSTALGEL
ncbi:MAG: aspartate aminotransferase family protein [Pseudomonadota bacterium]